MVWARAMGDTACVTACALIRAADAAATAAIASRTVDTSIDTETAEGACGGITTGRPPTVISLFAGRGSVLAVANEMGMDAVGIELSRKRCATALTLRLLRDDDLT